MKKLLLSLAVTGIFATAAIAQDQKTTTSPDPKQQKIEWEKKIKAELNLTAEQTVKFDALSKEYNDKFDVLMTDASLSQDARKEKKMALKKEKEVKLFEFLTPDQQTKYKELVERKKDTKPIGNK
jgi:Spy/CpxP family protein refolding chaperone